MQGKAVRSIWLFNIVAPLNFVREQASNLVVFFISQGSLEGKARKNKEWVNQHFQKNTTSSSLKGRSAGKT